MDHKIEDLLFTLEICRKNLPSNTHQAHLERLWYIENLLKAWDRWWKRNGKNGKEGWKCG